MKAIIVVLVCTSLWGGAYPQDTDDGPTSAPLNVTSHGDVQIVYTDEFMKVIEKYGITDDDIMSVTNKYKEGNPPTVTKMVKDIDTGDEKVVEVDLTNFIAGGHVTDLAPILEPLASENTTTVEDVPPTPEVPPSVISPTAEEVFADLRKREQDLLLRLEKNRQEYEEIAQALMDVRREIALSTPDEYDILSGPTVEEVPILEGDPPGSPFKQTQKEVNPTANPNQVEEILRLQALRQALIRDALRRHLLRRRMALMTGFPVNSPREFMVQPTRTHLIPVRRLGTPFFIRVNRRPLITLEPTQLPIVVDRRNPEIQTRPFEPIPRVTNIVVEDTGDDTSIPDPVPQ